MNIRSFEKIVLDRTDKFNESQFNKNVARVIKNKRIQNNLTQSDIAKGICSISYISKIESGKCPPDNFYVREVMGRMGITLEEVMVSEFSQELYDVIEAIYHDDVHKVQLLLELTEGTEVLSAKLVQASGRLYLGDSIELIIDYINAFKTDLTDFELMVFMYVIALYESNHMRYLKAKNYLLLLKELENNNDYLRFLIDLLMANCCLYIGHYVECAYFVNQVEKYLYDSYEILNLYKVKLLQIELLIYTKKNDLAKKELDRFVRINNEKLECKYHLMMGLIEIDQDKRMSAINHFLKAQKYYLEDALLFTIMGYFKMNNKVKVDEYLEILMENTNQAFYRKIGMYYQIKMNDNMYELREYINKNLLQTMKKVEYDYFYDQVMNDLIKFHRFNSRYKAVDELRHKMSDKR